MIIIIKFFICVLILRNTRGEYRLLETVVPTYYNINIKIDNEALQTGIIKSQATIEIKVLNLTQELKLHANNINFESLNLKNYSITFNTDPKTNILTITTEEKLPPGIYNLQAHYTATLYTENEMYGLYRSVYKGTNNEKRYLAATQLAITDARTLFPCFDEPAMKATFTWNVQYSSDYMVLSNSQPGLITNEGGLNLVEFIQTPPMATYVVALVVSDFTCNLAEQELKISVCSRNDTASDRQFALDIATKVVPLFEAYTGVAYNISGLGKIDLVALPDFSYSAMENWGLITFKESVLLYNEYYSTNSHKQRIARIVAHELAHMWLGNLVTTKWWSDTFLNEGMATYFMYFILTDLLDDWELDRQFVVEYLHTALIADSDEALALSSPVSTQSQINARFDDISYNKGGSVIRMIAHVMSLDNFQKGIQTYLDIYKFNNVLAGNLWETLSIFSQQPYPIDEVAKNWTYKPGYPVLQVKKNGTDVIITQTNKSGTKWYVPITYSTSNTDKKSIGTAPQLWLTPDNVSITIPTVILNSSDWIILNNKQTGYYRINYDENLWQRLKIVLRDNPNEIDVINRAQIVDDLFYFASAGELSYSKLFDLISFLHNETQYYPWYSAFVGFSKILPKISNSKIKQTMNSYIFQLMGELYRSVPISTEDTSNQIYSLKQALAFTWACHLEVVECINQAEEIFNNFKNKNDFRKNLMSSVYCTCLRHSTNPEEDFKFIWEKYNSSNVFNEKETILSALGCSTDNETLTKYLQYTYNTSSEIRRQDISIVLRSIISSKEGVDATLQFFVDNYDQIYNYYNDEKSVATFISTLVSKFSNEEQIFELKNFIETGKFNQELASIANNILERARTNLVENYNFEKELSEYFKLNTNVATQKYIVNMFLFVLLFVVTIVIK